MVVNPIRIKIGPKIFEHLQTSQYFPNRRVAFGTGVVSFSTKFIPVEIGLWKRDLSMLCASIGDHISKTNSEEIGLSELNDLIKTISGGHGLAVKVELFETQGSELDVLPGLNNISEIFPVLVPANYSAKTKHSVTVLINGKEQVVVNNIVISKDAAKLLSLEGRAAVKVEEIETDNRPYNMVMNGDIVSSNVVLGRAVVIKDKHLKLEDYSPRDLKDEAEKMQIPFEKFMKDKIRLTNEAFDKGLDIFTKAATPNFKDLEVFVDMIKGLVLQLMNDRGICAADAMKAALNDNFSGLRDSKEAKPKSIYADLKRFCEDILSIKNNSWVDFEDRVLNSPYKDVVLVAEDASIIKMGIFKLSKLRGFIRELGSNVDHVSNRTREANKGGLAGVKGAVDKIQEGDHVAVDGRTGELIYKMNAGKIKEYHKLISSIDQILDSLKQLRGVTLKLEGSDKKFRIMANIASDHEAEEVFANGYDEIGLVRTEIYFASNADDTPRETEPEKHSQTAFYNKIIAAAKGKPVTFRTIDPDTDKPIAYLNIDGELGIESKGLTKCLEKDTPMYFAFRNQLESFLATHGSCRVMFPVVRTKSELDQTFELIETIRNEMRARGETVNEDIEWGVMLEHSMVLKDLSEIIDDPRVKFFSVGTNDLTAEILRLDRTSGLASKLFNELDPKVLKVLKDIIDRVGPSGKSISVCGNMGNDWKRLLVLYAMGYSKVSLVPNMADVARKFILSLNQKDLDSMLKVVMKLKSATEIEKYIEEFAQQKMREGKWDLKDIELLLFPKKD